MTSSARPPAPATARRHLVTRTVLASGVGAVIAFTLAACGGSSTAATNKSPSNGPTSSSGQTPRNPGVSGKIADVEGSTIQIQSTDTQTAVTFSAATTITAQQAATLADVKVGSCIVATAATSSDASSDASPDATSPAAPLAATTIQIRPATTSTSASSAASGSCGLGGFGGGPNGTGGFGNGTRPSGAPNGGGLGNGPEGNGTPPSASSSRRPGNGTRGGAAAIGEVVSVSGDTIVVNEVTFGGVRNGTSSAQPTPSASPSTRARTITVSNSTTYSTTATATSSALVVGKCATAQGKADSSGTVAATAIEVTDPVNGACNGTLIRRFGGQGGGANPRSGGTTQNGGSGA